MSPESLQGEALGLVSKVGRACRTLPYWVFAVLVVLVGIIRIGPLGVGAEVLSWFRSSAASWPEPSHYSSGSLGPTVLMWLGGSPSDTTWWIGALVAWLATIGFLLVAVRRFELWGRLMVVAIAVSPAFSVSLTLIGHYDLFLIWGTLLVVLSRNRVLLAVGVLLAVLGNPQASLVAGIALSITAVGLGNRRLVFRGIALASVAVVAVIGIFLWFLLAGSSVDRFSTVTQDALGLSTLRNFGGIWPLAIYAFFGPLWLVMLIAWSSLRRVQLLLVLVGTVGLPLVATLVTWDGTRVFVAVGLASLIAALEHSWKMRWSHFPVSDTLLGGAVLILILSPSVIVDSGGLLRLPYGDLLDLAGWEAVWQPR